MSRTYLNYEPPTLTVQRRNRRNKFIEIFNSDDVPLGPINIDKLCEKTKVPKSRALAFLLELKKLGQVDHHYFRVDKHGWKSYVAVWSKIK